MKKTNEGIKILIIVLVLVSIIIYFTNSWGVDSDEESNNYIKNQALKKYTIRESAFPDEVFGVKVITDLINETSERRPGIKREIKYIIIHETGNKDMGTNAKSHANYLKEDISTNTSWHYTVDDHEIYHHLPDNEVAWHAGDTEGNANGIGIELCINKDGSFNKTFKNAAKLVAYLLEEYELDIDSIKTHKDFSGKDCPSSILKNDRMDEFKDEVKRLLDSN